MYRTISRLAQWTLLVGVLILTGCATQQQQPQNVEIRKGVIEQITPTEIKSEGHPGVAAIVGGVAGAGLGSLMGAGTGKDVMMVVGAIGGAIGGAALDKKYEKPVSGQQVIVRMNNGVLVAITQPENSSLHSGQAVYIEGAGNTARVVPQ